MENVRLKSCQVFFSDHTGVKLGSNKRKWENLQIEIKQHSLNNQWVKKKNQKGKNSLSQTKMDTQHNKTYGMLQKLFPRQNFSNNFLY